MNIADSEYWEKVNIAIAKYLNLGFMWKPANEKSIKEELGYEVADKVQEIYNFANSINVNWQKESMEDALARLEEQIRMNYDNLDDDSVKIIKRCFAYNWK